MRRPPPVAPINNEQLGESLLPEQEEQAKPAAEAADRRSLILSMVTLALSIPALVGA